MAVNLLRFQLMNENRNPMGDCSDTELIAKDINLDAALTPKEKRLAGEQLARVAKHVLSHAEAKSAIASLPQVHSGIELKGLE